MTSPLAGRSVLVTGGTGFLGQHVTAALRARGVERVVAPGSAEVDLRLRRNISWLLGETRPDVILHLAAVVGGIGANMKEPGRFFYENAIMGIELMEQARRHGVGKFVTVGTVCAYPKHTPVPFREEDLWNGYPEETNAPYGLAKKMLLVQGQAYRRQYDFNAIYLLPVNLYGPGDHDDPENSHVIPALIRKFVEARDRGAPEVVCWGTGRASREFLYVADAAEGILLAAEHYDKPEPVNLGTGQEITIAGLAQAVSDRVGYTGRIVWDASRPDGQPRRCLDTTRAWEEFGFRATTPFAEGLRRTISRLQPALPA